MLGLFSDGTGGEKCAEELTKAGLTLGVVVAVAHPRLKAAALVELIELPDADAEMNQIAELEEYFGGVWASSTAEMINLIRDAEQGRHAVGAPDKLVEYR